MSQKPGHVGDAPSASADKSISITPDPERQDEELLLIYASFMVAHEELDRLVECDAGSEEKFVAVHDQWVKALSRALMIPARTAEGQRAKSDMLRLAARVSSGEQ